MKRLLFSLFVVMIVISGCSSGEGNKPTQIDLLGNVSMYGEEVITDEKSLLKEEWFKKFSNRISKLEKGEFITYKHEGEEYLAVSNGIVSHPLTDVEITVRESNDDVKITLNTSHEDYIDEPPHPTVISLFSIDTNKKISVDISR